MTNFVLLDAPDFVLLVASDDGAAAPCLGQPLYLNPVLADALRISGVALFGKGHSAELSFDGASMRVMHGLLARYGFELPPITVAEFYGLLEYCDRLDALSGTGLFAAEQLPAWRALSAGLDRGGLTPGRQAIDLYSHGDHDALRALHRESGTLARLGRAYVAAEEALAALRSD